MKSIKPGRGPSFMNGIGSVFTVLFAIVWTGIALSMGAPAFFVLFGVLFISFGIIQAIYEFKNATAQNRYSEFDITDEKEEVDPFNEKWGTKGKTAFCPYCGRSLDEEFEFCPQCGKKILK